MKNIKNKKIFLIAGIVIFVNLGLFLFFRFRNQTKLTPGLPLSQPSQSTSSGQQPVDQPADSIQQDLPPTDPVTQDLPPANADQPTLTTIGGVLIGDGNPWTIIYDDAATGAPAATLELVFTDQGVCDFGQGFTSCTPMYYEVGTGIEAIGRKDGSKLIVSQIERAVPLMGQ